MKVNTEIFDEIEIKEEDIINFPKGLLGFEELKEFILLDVPGNPFFKWLQSIEESGLAFLVTNPFQFIPDYEFELYEKDKEVLAPEKTQDMVTFVIVSVPEIDISQVTANLLGPIVININSKRAKQLVLSDNKYSTKTSLFQSSKKQRQKATVEGGL